MEKQTRRFCVFCGEKPVSKTNEHIIPLWLIKLTGDPNRKIKIGPLIGQEKILELSFDMLQFPACKECNERFGKLEDSAKPIVENLIAPGKVSSQDFDIFLDWLDKVRIGLWLGYHHLLDKNFWRIKPNFHILDRMGTSDRAVIIYRTQNFINRINFTGVNTPAFAHSPTCFTLTINNFSFINVSTDFLLAKHSGLPYPRIVFVTWENQILINLPVNPGTEKLSAPLLGYNYDKRSTVIAQPIYSKYTSIIPDDYETEYVHNMTISPGKCKPLFQKHNSLNIYPSDAVIDWLPNELHDNEWLMNKMYTQTLQLQIELLKRTYVARNEDDEKKRAIHFNINNCIKVNRKLLSVFKNDF